MLIILNVFHNFQATKLKDIVVTVEYDQKILSLSDHLTIVRNNDQVRSLQVISFTILMRKRYKAS